MKVFFLICFVFFCCLSVNSQSIGVQNEFKPYWNIGVNQGMNWFLAEGNNFLNPNKPSNFSIFQNGGAISRFEIGYAMSPIFGIRSFICTAQHNWSDSRETDRFGSFKKVAFGSENISIDAMFNLSNLLREVNNSRKLDVIAFCGVGVLHRDKSVFSKNLLSGLFRSGFQLNYFLTKDLVINAIVDCNIGSDRMNDYSITYQHDIILMSSVGVSYRLPLNPFCLKRNSISTRNTPSQLLSQRTQVFDNDSVELINLQCNDSTKYTLINQPSFCLKLSDTITIDTIKIKKYCDTSETIFKPKQEVPHLFLNVFFKTNESIISDQFQIETIEKAFNYLKSNPSSSIIVSGSCDVTNPLENQNSSLSKQRAISVSELIIKYGIDPKRIHTKVFSHDFKPFMVNTMNQVVVIATYTQP